MYLIFDFLGSFEIYSSITKNNTKFISTVRSNIIAPSFENFISLLLKIFQKNRQFMIFFHHNFTFTVLTLLVAAICKILKITNILNPDLWKSILL